MEVENKRRTDLGLSQGWDTAVLVISTFFSIFFKTFKFFSYIQLSAILTTSAKVYFFLGHVVLWLLAIIFTANLNFYSCDAATLLHPLLPPERFTFSCDTLALQHPFQLEMFTFFARLQHCDTCNAATVNTATAINVTNVSYFNWPQKWSFHHFQHFQHLAEITSRVVGKMLGFDFGQNQIN